MWLRSPDPPLPAVCHFVQILNGRAWVIVDGAVLDVSSFSRRHPGGARLILNAMGTDVTAEIIGKDASIGNSSMTFAPHSHTSVSSRIQSLARLIGQVMRRGPGGKGRGWLRSVRLTVLICLGCTELLDYVFPAAAS